MRRNGYLGTFGQNLTPLLAPATYSLCHFQGATTKIKPCHYTIFMGLWWRLRIVYIAASQC